MLSLFLSWFIIIIILIINGLSLLLIDYRYYSFHYVKYHYILFYLSHIIETIYHILFITYYGNNFPRIVGILSYVLCFELNCHFCEIFNVTLGVPNAMEVSVVWWRREKSMASMIVWRATCPTFIKLNSFICLTYHLSEHLKIPHKFFPTTYTNQKFWFHLCYIQSPWTYNTLNKIMYYALVHST